MKNRIKVLICVPLLIISLSTIAQTTKTITIENYTAKPLTFIKPVKSTNSTIDLPNRVKRGTGTSFSKATGTIRLELEKGKVSGVFVIGYNNHQFCKYQYTMDPQTGSAWFMYASKGVNMSGTSCIVDVDKHQIIVFQKMG